MIVDVHGHFTQAPLKLHAFRAAQIARQNRPSKPDPQISDDEIREALEANMAQMDARGIDKVMFSPQASAMGHHFGSELISRYWTEVNNDLIKRACAMYPDRLIPVCQLPQTPGVGPENCLPELERCAAMGFVGCNVNPDVSGGVAPLTPSLGDRWWYPLWEKLVELDMPAMIHASATLNPALHVNGTHYINQDTAAVFELCDARVFQDFPALKLIIPHGGGAVAFQYNRYRALNVLRGKPRFEEVVSHLYFDLAVYDVDAIDFMLRKFGVDNVLYAAEMFGTGKAIDPETGRAFDDTIGMINAIDWLSEADRAKIFEGNARRLFSRVDW